MSKKELVSAGEVCSIDIAKKYGFFDKNKYYTNEYSDVKTYTDIDKQENRDSNEVCWQTSNKKVAYPACTLVYGIPYEQKPSDRSKCVVNMGMFCPKKLQKGDQCKRSNILPPPPISMKSRCDEKPTDWYMIPNYHLGNGYGFVKEGKTSKCMKPCSVDRVPGFTQDPVDGASAGMLTNTTVNQCYYKTEYMGGKYNGTNNFCPISWVYRLGQKEEDIIADIVEKIQENDTSNSYSTIATGIASKEAKSILLDGKKLLENVEFPNNVMMAACSKINTPERVKTAYKICKEIHSNPDSINNLLTNKAQQKVLRKACHTLFCNEQDDLVSTIDPGADPLCFPPNVDKATNDELLENDKNLQKDSEEDVDIGPPPKINEPEGLSKSTKIVILISIIALLIIIGTIVFLFAGKFIIYVYREWWLPLWRRIKASIMCSNMLYALKGITPGNTFGNAGVDKQVCVANIMQPSIKPPTTS